MIPEIYTGNVQEKYRKSTGNVHIYVVDATNRPDDDCGCVGLRNQSQRHPEGPVTLTPMNLESMRQKVNEA